jgi:PadR family transcriptional regulator, regulatory protein PadR
MRLTPQTIRVLDCLMAGKAISGAEITAKTSLKSGSLYPILMRLEAAGWVSSEWEEGDPADLGRPRRRYYSITPVGARKARKEVREHAAFLGRLAWT